MQMNGWPPASRDVLRSATGAWRGPAAGVVALGMAAAVLGAVRKGGLELTGVVAEVYTVLEWGEVFGWIVIAGVALAACLRQPVRRGVLLGMWLGVVACLAALREMDLHVLLNPGNIHYLGLEAEQAVRFRIDWWLAPETGVGLRAAWAVVLLLIPAAALVPFALAEYPWPRRLLKCDRFAVLTAGGFTLLAAAYVGDDLLANGSVPELAEELVEVAGMSLLLVSTGMLALGKVRLHGPGAKGAAA